MVESKRNDRMFGDIARSGDEPFSLELDHRHVCCREVYARDQRIDGLAEVAARSMFCTGSLFSPGSVFLSMLTQIRPPRRLRDQGSATSVMLARDEAAVIRLLPNGQAWACVHHFGIRPWLGPERGEEVHDQRV
jgi:hypothetical protein